MKKTIGIIIALVVIVGLVHILQKTKNNQDVLENQASETMIPQREESIESEILGLENETSLKQEGELIQESKNLDGTSWVFGEKGKLSFGNGRYVATAGCNTLNGEYRESGAEIEFNAGISTLMACPDIQEAEDNLKEVFNNATEYKRANDTLILLGGGISLVLDKETNAELVDTQWNISTLRTEQGITSSVVDTDTYIRLSTDGTFSGKSACNSIMGLYKITANNISFSNIGSTRMLCAEEENNREQVLINALSQVSEFMIKGDMLTLSNSDKVDQIQLTSK